jgi:hypothetical protein
MKRALILFSVLLSMMFLVSFLACNAKEKKEEQEVVKEVQKDCPPCPCDEEKKREVPENAVVLPDSAGPATSILYHLTDMYVPVKFSHKEHTQYSKNCSECHHHQSDVEKTPACRECHGIASSATLSKPGLKGAYHRQCMNCHRSLSAGPLACEACHAKRTGAGATPAKLASDNAPSKVTLGHLSKEYKPVDFDHKLHAALSDTCVHCHHHHGEVEETPPCRECHNVAETKEGTDKLGLKDAYHRQCQNCHKGKGEGPIGCTGCHAKK